MRKAECLMPEKPCFPTTLEDFVGPLSRACLSLPTAHTHPRLTRLSPRPLLPTVSPHTSKEILGSDFYKALSGFSGPPCPEETSSVVGSHRERLPSQNRDSWFSSWNWNHIFFSSSLFKINQNPQQVKPQGMVKFNLFKILTRGWSDGTLHVAHPRALHSRARSDP